MRTYCYIDGFNFYYSCIKGTNYKWMNVRALLETIFPHVEITHIRYFTAKVTGTSRRSATGSTPTILLRARYEHCQDSPFTLESFAAITFVCRMFILQPLDRRQRK